MINIEEILSENQRRIDHFNRPYDPNTGLGSPIPRTKVIISDLCGGELWLPNTMLDEPMIREIVKCGSLAEYAKTVNLDESDDIFSDVLQAFIFVRFKHDFEYWAFTCIKIQDALTLDDVPFRLRHPQRKYLIELEDMRTAGLPIRVIVDKARQWGGSTLTQIYMMWIQQIHKTNWHMAVCAQDDSAARNINAMYTRAAELYPKEVGTITLSPYERSPKNRICDETGGIIGVGSYISPDQFRSYNYPMVHLSEVGVWQDTIKRKASNIAQSLRNAVKYVPYSLVALESTAKGVGNFFHSECLAAIEGKSYYRFIFVAWWEIEIYQTEIVDYKKFISTMTEYEWYLWRLGATLEGIYWYRLKKDGDNLTDWQMMEEFPSTWQESFQSSGHKYFDPKYIQAIEKDVCKPEFIGDAFGDGRTGKKALTNCRLTIMSNGPLHAWSKPDPKTLVKYRYAGFLDIGGKTSKADWSVFSLIDRIWMIDGGDPEFILTWRGHLDQDLVAWKAAQICMAFAVPEIGEYPLLAVEMNSLKKESTEGDHFLTILNHISDYYPNLYIRNDFERVGDGFIPKYGFQTNQKTKTMILDAHNAAARERFLEHLGEKETWGYVEHDQRAINEMWWLETKPDGSIGAVDGRNDDIEITRAGCIWLANHYMAKPFYVEKDFQRGTRKGRTRESSF